MKLLVEDLAFRYGRTTIFSNISFQAESGTVLAVLGQNGSGKTTLLRCLNLQLRPCSGTISLDGRNYQTLLPRERAKLAAFLPQRCESSGLTVFDAVLLGRSPFSAGLQVTNDELDRVDRVLQMTGLSDKALCPLDRLSGGELQKTALARVLVQEARLLILDEPTSSLDMKNESEILSILRQEAIKKDIIVIMSVHNVNMAIRFADRLILLKDGKLLSEVRPGDVPVETLEALYGLDLEEHHSLGTKYFFPVRDRE